MTYLGAVPNAGGEHNWAPRVLHSFAQRRHLSDDALLIHINAIHAETRGGYGWPLTWKELIARGLRLGKERTQKLMQLHSIRAKGTRRFKITTDSRHDLPISPNLREREFTVAEPNKVWTGDITYIATEEGWSGQVALSEEASWPTMVSTKVTGGHHAIQARLTAPPSSTL